MNSTVGTIKHRHQTTLPNNPAEDVSKNVWNDSEPVASAADDGAVMVRDSGQTDGWGFSVRPQLIDLRGSRQTSLPLVSGWQNGIDYIDIEITGGDYGGLNVTLRVECRTDDAASPVTPRLYNVTDGATAGDGVACAATALDYSGTNSIQTVTITLSAGTKKYRLQGFSNGTNPVYVIGYLQIGG